MNALARAKPLPIYLQISELLTRQIRAGHWRAGERLPTEAELAESLGVAVGTLRKSLALLQEQQVLERIQGSGTYVRSSQSGKSIYEFFVFFSLFKNCENISYYIYYFCLVLSNSKKIIRKL